MNSPFQVTVSETTGQVASVKLYDHELLDQTQPCESELWVNGYPLPLSPPVDPEETVAPLKIKRQVEALAPFVRHMRAKVIRFIRTACRHVLCRRAIYGWMWVDIWC